MRESTVRGGFIEVLLVSHPCSELSLYRELVKGDDIIVVQAESVPW